ncbi:hypothetical protein [Pedobacter sp. UBA5917]|jgi:hypothetical protein|uniref:hypothetical protein n=1 Tax=Pedobacter sp. UBA5917 TaxID=1947061 RepID=UPI0025FE7D45|nr:hypothetical protein [Pedobacter sp. UBA5917]
MKRYILTVLVGLLAITGCKKEKLNENELGNQKLQGKWLVTNLKRTTLKNGKVVESEEKPDGTVIFEFSGNRLSLTEGKDPSQSYSYTVEANEIVLRSDGNEAVFFRYSFNSDTQLSLTQSETVTQNNVTSEESQTYVMTKM